MDNLLPAAALSATVLAFINFLRYARGRDWNGVLTQASVWAAGVGGAALFAQTEWASSIALMGPTPLSLLDGWSLVVLGLQLGSAATVINEFRGAIDRSTTTAKPRLADGNTVMVNVGAVTIDPPPPNTAA